MATISEGLKRQIEEAYGYRGHVTVTLAQGGTVVGFLFNREYANPKLEQDFFIDLIVKDSGERRRYPMAQVASIALTGEDHAAGKSYEDYLKKKAAERGG